MKVAMKLTIKFFEVVNKMGMHNFLLKKVFLVQEEDDRRFLEPGVADYGVKEMETLPHTIHFLVCVCV